LWKVIEDSEKKHLEYSCSKPKELVEMQMFPTLEVETKRERSKSYYKT
jgi:hypothetical protein